MKTAAINLSFKLLMLTSFLGSANFAIATSDIVECQPALSTTILNEKPLKELNHLEKRLQCAREKGLSKEITQKNIDALCRAHTKCQMIGGLSSEKMNNLLAEFAIKKRLKDELPRTMIYSAVKDFLEKEKAFPEKIKKNGLAQYQCATNEEQYSIQGSINWIKKVGAESSCDKSFFDHVASKYYSNCGGNRECFGDLDKVLGASKDLKNSKSPLVEGYIKHNTDELIAYYRANNSDDYVEEIRQDLLANNDIDAILKKYRNKSPVLMAMYMSGKDRATTEILSDLNPIRFKEVANLKKAKSKSPEEFKAIFKKFQIAVGQGMFSTCDQLRENKKFFPWNAAKICKYGGQIAAGRMDAFSLEKYSDSMLEDFYNDLNLETQRQGYNDSVEVTNYAICHLRATAALINDPNKFTDEEKKYLGVRENNNSSKAGAYIDYEKYDLEIASNSAIDSNLDNALINQEKFKFEEDYDKKLDENAVIQANNQNLRGQNSVDSSAFMNNFGPIDNYSGLTNEYVNKSYINRADKLKTESTSSSSEANLNKQYSDIEAKIAEAEARLKELQQGMGEVGKNKNQPVVSNGVSREKTQSSSEIEELLKEIKELKAQNNEIKEKLVAKANTEKAEKVAEKQTGSFNNSPGLAFSSGNKNDYKFESKPVEIKPTSSYSSSQSSSAMRAPSSLGAAKLGSQASGAILSAVDNKADAVTPARAVTRVDSFNSESARKAITSRINEINKNTKEMEQSKATIEIDGQLKEVISFEVLDEKGQKKLVVVELKDGKVVVDKDGNPIYVSQDMTDDSIIITKKGKDEKSVKKLQSQADVKRVDELKLQKGRSAERVKLNDLTRSAVKAKP